MLFKSTECVGGWFKSFEILNGVSQTKPAPAKMFAFVILLVLSMQLYESQCGTVSKPLRDFTKPVTHVYLDFDETISTDGLSGRVRNIFCNTTDSVACDCTRFPGGLCNGTDKASADGMITALKSLPSDGLPSITQSMAGVGKKGYVRVGRQKAVQDWLKRLRKALNGNLFIVSTSWYPITGLQWKNYLLYISKTADLGFDSDHVLSLPDPGPGISADKGGVIRANMKTNNGAFDTTIFADDSAGNIKSAKDVCNTLHMTKRRGMDDTDRDYIETLVSGCCQWKASASASVQNRAPFAFMFFILTSVILANMS